MGYTRLVVRSVEPEQPVDALLNVPLLRWPADDEHAAQLESLGRPFLLLVPAGAPPPISGYRFMDWVRSPVDPDELVARRENLEARFMLSAGGPRPELDDETGRLRYGHGTADVNVAHVAALRALVDRFRDIVPVESMRCAFQLPPVEADEALSSRVVRLRRAIGPAGLEIRRVRGVGFTLEPARPRRTPSTGNRQISA